ncbi:MAG TPA: heavy metal translocating P-type ATPase, partial [Egibacteraceae bacterium]
MSTPPAAVPARMRGVPVPHGELATLVLTLAGLAAGGAAALAGLRTAADWLWGGAIAVALVPLTTGIVASLRRREPGVDVVALLAMTGALLLGELLAGAVIAVMLTGGQALERVAAARAGRELSALLAGAPRTAHRRRGDGVEEIPAEQVAVGDVLVVPPGASVPVDGIVVSPVAVLDEAAITGESRPVERLSGERVASGAVNGGGPFDLRAVATAAESTYAGIVRLVREAQTAKAPFVRLADRTAGVFVPLTLVLAGAAWALAGDPRRALAVLVVATPCPLLLAAPIAIVSGISAAARRGVIVKGGPALERLAEARIAVLDKTGTLTTGRPRVAEVEAFGTLGFGAEQVLRVAAALEQVSSHPFAPSIVRAARERGMTLPFPRDVAESPGAGIAGDVEGRRVAVGSADWVTAAAPLPAAGRALRRRASLEGASAVFVAVDDVPVGGLLLDDPLRADAPRALRALRRSGVERVIVLSGDHPDVAEVIGSAVGADRVLAQRTPREKVETVLELAGQGVMVVGDGVNDAPALAVADVGVAMGARGAAASSQAADVVLTVDRLDRLPEARAIAIRSRRIAWQSVLVGMGLSLVAMGVAAAGLLAPVAGALVQEAID